MLENVPKDDLLSYVRPLYPNGFLPLGAGWGVLLCAIVAVAGTAFLFYNRLKARRRREALALLQKIKKDFLKNGGTGAAAAAVSAVLKRMAMNSRLKKDAAALTGSAWSEFLIETGAELNDEDKILLEQTAFRPDGETLPADRGRVFHLIAAAERWTGKVS